MNRIHAPLWIMLWAFALSIPRANAIWGEQKRTTQVTLSAPTLQTGTPSVPNQATRADFAGPLSFAGVYSLDTDFDYPIGGFFSFELGFLPLRNAYPVYDLRLGGTYRANEDWTLGLVLGAISKDAFMSGIYQSSDNAGVLPAWAQFIIGLNARLDTDYGYADFEAARYSWMAPSFSGYEGKQTIVSGKSMFKLGALLTSKSDIGRWGYLLGAGFYFLGDTIVAASDFGYAIPARTVFKVQAGVRNTLSERWEVGLRYAFVGMNQGDPDWESLYFQAPYFNRDYLLSTHSLYLEAKWTY